MTSSGVCVESISIVSLPIPTDAPDRLWNSINSGNCKRNFLVIDGGWLFSTACPRAVIRIRPLPIASSNLAFLRYVPAHRTRLQNLGRVPLGRGSLRSSSVTGKRACRQPLAECVRGHPQRFRGAVTCMLDNPGESTLPSPLEVAQNSTPRNWGGPIIA